MSDFHNTHVRIVDEVLNGDDIARLATVLDAMRLMRAPIGLVEPEKTLVKKRRLLPDVYDRSGYACSITFGAGDKYDPATPLSFDLTIDTPPDEDPVPLDVARQRFGAGGVPLPPSWELLDDIAPHILHISVLDARPHTSNELARFVLGSMRALGATTPTQRWSCQWQITKNDEIPAA